MDQTTVLASKFCDALRSGHYKQCHGRSRDPETGAVSADEVLRIVAGKRGHFDMSADPVVRPVAHATFNVGNKRYGLVGLNDVVKATLPEIADMVAEKFVDNNK